MVRKNKKLLTTAKYIFPLLLLVFAIIELKKFIKGIDIQLFQHEINQLHFGTLILILALTFTAVLPMLMYDVMLVNILGLRLVKRELLEQALIANSFSNLFGLGGLIGVMLRTYFYNKHVPVKRRLLEGIAFVSFFYLTGISMLALIVVIGFHSSPVFVQTKWLYFAVLAISLYLPVFIGIHIYKAKVDKQSFFTLDVGVKLFFISVMEWAAMFLAILFLCEILNISISIKDLFPVFVVAICAGIISMIPGGLGSFDVVLIWGMLELRIPEEKVIVLLLFYRIGYYLVPFLISVVLFVKRYWDNWNESWSNLPNTIIQRFSHVILTALVFLSGIILLLSASVPGIISRLRIAQELVYFPIINLSHQLTVIAGFLLLGLSRGIEYNVKRAYELTIIVLIFAAVFSIFKGLDYEEAIFLILVALLLKLSKGYFYRESYVLTWGKTAFDILLVVVITSMYLVIGYLNLPNAKIELPEQLLSYVILDSRDLFNSAIIGIFVAFFIFFFGYLKSKPEKWKFEETNYHEPEIIKHLKRYHENNLSHLQFLKDKKIFWNRKRNILLTFQPYADKLVILGDPIGERSELSNTIEEFQALADLHGYTPVFYQVSDEMLPVLHGNGFTCFLLSPLPNGGLSKFSFISERIASQIFIQGQNNKVGDGCNSDNWETRYLGYRRKSNYSLPLIMVQITWFMSIKE
ncbi:phosphatidylglycerol lysyltransferase domain-containing protein [Neobacillus sp. FSL H8-0543]|uniref:phosphatidylglycerol lysyltransferase domain-containing protein n=1 Tax=Neobacillus sp. FSL H8-0543 TaxID=2954672 RepID=UPI0031588D75